MKNLLLIIILTIYCLINFNSCKTDKKGYETISLDLKSGIDDVNFKIKSIIKLETSDSSLIGRITKIVYFKDRFFILDRDISKTLFIFDKSGKFIAKTKRGRGPNECINPLDFRIDSINNRIQLWDQANFKMMEYDFDLNLIKSEFYKGVGLINAENINNDTLLVFSQLRGNITKENANKPSYFNYCIYSNTLNKPITKLLPTSKNLIGLSLESSICKTNRIIFVAPFDNTIYGIDKLQTKILYYLDFGKLNLTKDDLTKGISHIFQSARAGNRITSVDNLHENNQYLSFSFFYKKKLNFFIHSKDSKINYYSDIIFQEKRLPRCRLKGLTANGNFLAISSPLEIKSFKFSDLNYENIAQNTKEPDNPYIIIFNVDEIH